jgi:hypothetical protein
MVASSYPPALVPVYLMDKPNQPIELYSGSIEVAQDGITSQGNGTILYEWTPNLCLSFQWTGLNVPAGIQIGQIDLNITQLSTKARAIISAWSPVGRNLNLSGIITEPITLGFTNHLRHVIFHLVNFHRYSGAGISFVSKLWSRQWVGRMELEASNWRVTIDSLKEINDIERELDAVGGFGITHVGKLERADGTGFTAHEALEQLEALYSFLSFCRGLWSPPVLTVGFDIHGEGVWSNWSASNAKPWQFVDSWFPTMSPHQVSNAFSGFLRKWNDPIWNEPIRLAIHWYVEAAVQSGAIAGSIALTQVGLEMLSWLSMVEAGTIVSTRGFDGLPAADKIRLLISQSGIPLATPTELNNLASASNEKAWLVGPYAFTEIRNGIVHSTLSKRLKISALSSTAIYETWKLGLWYLELVLLRLFDYRGLYHNRLKRERFWGDQEPVPWV